MNTKIGRQDGIAYEQNHAWKCSQHKPLERSLMLMFFYPELFGLEKKSLPLPNRSFPGISLLDLIR
jgi:hypothetical protein